MNNVMRMDPFKENNVLTSKDRYITRLLTLLDQNMEQASQVHLAILNNQKQSLSSIYPIIELSKTIQQPSMRAFIFSKEQLQEFGNGSIEKCFGAEYASLDNRESPRIPNGDLLMIDHVISISGEPKKLSSPASVTSEFEVRRDAWFLSENEYPGVPLSIMMEIALQPCGFLSAYLGTSLLLPPENNRFRNLDGFINFDKCPNLAGKTITNHSILKDAFTSGGMHIQKYAFELSTNNSIFLEGESTFGYFTKSAMEQQAGLGPIDEQEKNGLLEIELPVRLGTHKKKHLDLIDTVNFVSTPANTGDAFLFGEKINSSDEWFYSGHFYQDPVMPGSLGAEAIMQSVWAFMKEKGYIEKFDSPQVSFSNGSPFRWKYRGQVTPINRKTRFQVHILPESISHAGISVTANADFWVDDLRIYSFNNLAFSIREG